jgi:hypothetical protein
MKTASSPTLISWRTSIQSILTQHPSGDCHQWFSIYLSFFHFVNNKNLLDYSYNFGNFLKKIIIFGVHYLSLINQNLCFFHYLMRKKRLKIIFGWISSLFTTVGFVYLLNLEKTYLEIIIDLMILVFIWSFSVIWCY